MTFKLKDNIARKFIYKVDGNKEIFINSLFSNVKHNTPVKNFLKFCKENEISHENFITGDDKYVLIGDEKEVKMFDHSIDAYGLHWKHLIEENINTIALNSDDTYNYHSDNKRITYSYTDHDFLENYKKKHDECENYVIDIISRREYMILEDYLRLGFYDFDIILDKSTQYLNGDIEMKLITPNNNMAEFVYSDFKFFYERNKVECPTCKRLVDNAFDEYMIQFYKHDGC